MGNKVSRITGLQGGPIGPNMYKLIITKRFGKRILNGSKKFDRVPKLLKIGRLV